MRALLLAARRRQGHPNVGATTVTVASVRLATMGAGNRPYDRQAEATTAVTIAGGGTAEALKGPPEKVLRKTPAVVSDVDLHGAVLFPGDEVDRALAVAEGVVDHAADRLVDAQTIGGDGEGGWCD